MKNTWKDDKYKTKYKIVAKLRQLSRWHPNIQECKKNAQAERGVYLCNGCKVYICTEQEGYYETSDEFTYDTVAVDHVKGICEGGFPERDSSSPGEPGDPNWNAYIDDLFFGELQILCGACHYMKSQVEREERMENKK